MGIGKHRAVDDEPYGGGAGMLMRPEPLVDAIEALRTDGSTVVLLMLAESGSSSHAFVLLQALAT